MARSKAQTNQTNGILLSHYWIGTDISLCRKWWVKPGFIAS